MSGNGLAGLIQGQLRVGSVIYTWCEFTKPELKYKYLLVVALEPSFLVLVISSQINQFYVTKGLDRFHVGVSCEDHEFLRHNSFADCIDAKACFELDDMKDQMIQSYASFHKGWLTEDCLTQVYDAVCEQTIMRLGLKKKVIAALKLQLCIAEPELEN
jgi:hypothetical protein